MRWEQDRVIDAFMDAWTVSDSQQRKQMEIRLVRKPNGVYHIKNESDHVLAEVELISGEYARCCWVRSVADLKLIRDVAGVKV